MTLVTITFDPARLKIKVVKGTNILKAAKEAGIAMRTECGGTGTCGKCKVIVPRQKALSGISAVEKRHLSLHELNSGYRLACQAVPRQNVQVLIPLESRIGERRILTHGVERRTKLNPLVRKFHVKLNKPTLSDPVPDYERLKSALLAVSNTDFVDIEYAILERLPDILRDADWDVTVTVWNMHRIIDIEQGDTTHALFGFAVDIGTSKIVGHLVDLNTGKTKLTTMGIGVPSCILSGPEMSDRKSVV